MKPSHVARRSVSAALTLAAALMGMHGGAARAEWVGPNLVVNGTFDDAFASWQRVGVGTFYLDTNYYMINGRTARLSGAQDMSLRQEIAIVPGKRYRLGGYGYTLQAGQTRQSNLAASGLATTATWFPQNDTNASYRSADGIATAVTTTVALNSFILQAAGANALSAFDDVSLTQVINPPSLALAQQSMAMNTTSPGGAGGVLATTPTSESFADAPTAWSIAWGDGQTQAQPTLSVVTAHAYAIAAGNNQSWTTTFTGTNEAGPASITQTLTLLRQPKAVLQVNGEAVMAGRTIVIGPGDPLDLSLTGSEGFVEQGRFVLAGRFDQTNAALRYADAPFTLADVDHTFALTASVSNSGGGTNANATSVNVVVGPHQARWSANANGNWGTAANWQPAVPNGFWQANFTDAVSAPRTVTLQTTQAVAAMTFDNLNRYTLAGTAQLTLDSLGTAATIRVLSGSHSIVCPIRIGKDTTIDVAPATGSLRLAGTMTAAAGVTLTKTGDGTLEVRHLRTDAVRIDAGTISVLAGGTGGSLSRLQSLTLAGVDDAWTATLDLANNSAILDYAVATPRATVVNQLKNGFNAGAWDGHGITSSAASGTAYGIGYLESADFHGLYGATATFLGSAVDEDALLLKYTLRGDADFDGIVDFGDLLVLAQHYGAADAAWRDGDSNYDGVADFADLLALAQNYGSSALTDSQRAALSSADDRVAPDWALARSLVPEPAALSSLGLLAALAHRRRLLTKRS